MSARLALVTGQYPPDIGGVGQSARRVARLLRDAGLTVDVVVMTKHGAALPLDEAITTTEEDGLHVHRVRVHHPGIAPDPPPEAEALTRYNREMFQALDHLARVHRWDLLLGFFLYPAGFVATAVAALHGLPAIVSIRGNDVGKYAFDPLRLPFVRATLERADRVVSVATSLTRLADGLITPIAAKSRTILNSIDLDPSVPRPRPPVAMAGPVVGSAGLFRYKKGLIYLFKALSGMNGAFGTLLLAGDWFSEADREPHERAIADLGLTARTRVTGRIPSDQMAGWLELFDVLVFPSLFSEGCPRAMLEAMALGKAVIGSRSGAIPEILRDGENGLLVNPGSAVELERALVALAADPSLRARLGAGARRTACELTGAREAQAWLEVIEAALAGAAA